jgi:hypothetical protein
VGHAWRFFSITTIPLALYVGIIDHTRTLLFAEAAIVVQGNATGDEIVFDVLRAALVQIGMLVIDMAALTLPYISLVRAYGESDARNTSVPLIAILRRTWMLYATMTLLMTGGWIAMTKSGPNEYAAIIPMVGIGAIVLIAFMISALGRTARDQCGVGPFVSVVVTILPFVLWYYVRMLSWRGFQLVLPEVAS